MDFETRAIHEGQEPDPATGSVVVPIYQTSTYAQDAVGQHKGYEYSRAANPTRTALELCLASLESAENGVAFASGMAAVTTVMHLVHPNERVVSVNDVYGGTYRLFSQVYAPKGYEIEYLSAQEINDGLADRIDERTRLVWLETPTNPLLNVIDIQTAVEAAHAVNAIVVVDNTFATPYLQRPLELGADIVLHSTTKYLSGHSDVIGGFVAMISFLAASEEEAVELVTQTDIWTLAESLGSVESLIEHPARMTHASTADGPFAAPRNLIRLSVGIESVDDLIADLEAALVRSAAAAGA